MKVQLLIPAPYRRYTSVVLHTPLDQAHDVGPPMRYRGRVQDAVARVTKKIERAGISLARKPWSRGARGGVASFFAICEGSKLTERDRAALERVMAIVERETRR